MPAPEFVDHKAYLEGHPRRVREAIRERHLRLIGWETTKECDMDCLHCGNPQEWKTAEGPDLTTGEAKRIFREIAEDFDAREITVGITGGELTLRRDIQEMIEYITGLGFRVGLSTNGYNLGKNPRLIDDLVRRGVRAFAISIDGMKKTHNVQRRKRSFAQVVKAIRYIRKHHPDAYVEVTTVTTTVNYSDLPLIHELLLKLGVRQWKICHLIPIGRAQTRPDLQISNDQTYQLFSWITAQNRQFRQEKTPLQITVACEGWCGDEFEGRLRDFLFMCAAGIQSVTITHDGFLGGCLEIPRELSLQGDLRKRRFKDIWENEFKLYRDKEWLKGDPHCVACEAWDFCQGGAMHQRTPRGQLIECIYHTVKDRKPEAQAADQLDDVPIAEVEFNPLLKANVDGKWIVGQEDTGTYGEFPEIGVRFLEEFEREKRVEVVSQKIEQETNQSYDIQDFLRAMLPSGFIKSVNGRLLDREKLGVRKIDSVFNRINPKWFSWVFTPPVAVVAAVLIVIGLGLMVTHPEFRPNYRNMIVSDFYTVAGISIMLAGMILISKHELFHFFAARRHGVKSAFRMSTRMYMLVMETDVSNVWVLPKRKKLVVYLAGAINDLTTMSICAILLYLGSADSWLARQALADQVGILASTYTFLANPVVIRIAKMVIFFSFYLIIFQMMFYLRTDFYYTIAHGLDCRNLLDDTRTFIFLRVIRPAAHALSRLGINPFRRKMAALVEKTKDVQLNVTDRERKIIYVYAPFFVAGVGVMLWFFFFNLLPVMMTMYYGSFEILYQAVAQGVDTVGWKSISDAFTFIFSHVVYYGAAAYLTERSRRRKARMQLSFATAP